MSRKKNLIQMLAACEKHDFDRVVKTYLREVYSYNRIVLTDGKDDCGLDIKVFDFSNQKLQYQMTIQKSSTSKEKAALKDKIFEDVAKAKENAEKYGWNNYLIFFYSYELTNKVIREYTKLALSDYGINLEIVDGNRIADESEEYLELQRVIYDTSGIAEFKIKKSLYDDENNNLIYDLVSFGQSVDIKLEIVEAYILRCLYEHERLSLNEISDLCLTKFSTTENQTFYSKLIQNLYNIKHKLSYNKLDKKYALTKEAFDEITRQSEQIKLDEQQFLNEIGVTLANYHQDANIDNYVGLLQCIYIESFDKRLNVQNDIDNIASFNNLVTFTKGQIKDDKLRISLIESLIKVCDNNKYLQKICASHIFSQKVNLNNLQRYAREKKQVFLDTTIALHILCYFYRNSDYSNYNYLLSKSLCDFCKKNDIKLYIINRYLWEIGTHIQEAFNLVPFTKLPNFTLLGKSRNVFFNHYNYLLDSGELDISYEEYLSNFGFTTNNNINCQIVENYLKNMGVIVVEHPQYDIQTEIKILGCKLSETGRFKTTFALNNDAIMLRYLGDNNPDIHQIDPVFVTWDKTMFGVLNDFYKNNPAAHRWMQFTPSQFIDRYSLLSFSINEETISKDILAIISGDIVQHTTSLIDSLSLILNPTDEVGLEYTKKIAKMKDSQIYTTSKIPDNPQEQSENNSVDRVVFEIISHYREDIKMYDSFKNLFTMKDCINDVVKIISDAVEYYQVNRIFDNNVIEKFNQLISDINK